MSGGDVDRIARLAMSDPLDTYEEGFREGWRSALAWAGVTPTPPAETGDQP